MGQNQIKGRAGNVMVKVTRRIQRERRAKKIKNTVIAVLACLFLGLLIVLLTPIGPDWQYNRLQSRKMAGAGEIQAGYVESLYKLSQFYAYTLRGDDANRCFDEISLLCFGFTLGEFVKAPDAALAKRNEALTRIGKGDGYFGPPFKIPEAELKYVGNAIWAAGQNYLKTQRLLTGRLYKGLYAGVLLADHPDSCDESEMKLVRDFVANNPAAR